MTNSPHSKLSAADFLNKIRHAQSPLNHDLLAFMISCDVGPISRFERRGLATYNIRHPLQRWLANSLATLLSVKRMQRNARSLCNSDTATHGGSMLLKSPESVVPLAESRIPPSNNSTLSIHLIIGRFSVPERCSIENRKMMVVVRSILLLDNTLQRGLLQVNISYNHSQAMVSNGSL